LPHHLSPLPPSLLEPGPFSTSPRHNPVVSGFIICLSLSSSLPLSGLDCSAWLLHYIVDVTFARSAPLSVFGLILIGRSGPRMIEFSETFVLPRLVFGGLLVSDFRIIVVAIFARTCIHFRLRLDQP
jgi:hypothetical protein